MTVAQLRTLLAPLPGDLVVEIAGEADPTDLDAVVDAWSSGCAPLPGIAASAVLHRGGVLLLTDTTAQRLMALLEEG